MTQLNPWMELRAGRAVLALWKPLAFTGVKVFTKTYNRSSHFLQATFRHLIIFTIIQLFIYFLAQSGLILGAFQRPRA